MHWRPFFAARWRNPGRPLRDFRNAKAPMSEQIATQVRGYVRPTLETAIDRARIRMTLEGREGE